MDRKDFNEYLDESTRETGYEFDNVRKAFAFNAAEKYSEGKKRDYFAGMVLQGFASDNVQWANLQEDAGFDVRKGYCDSREEHIAKFCYGLADAMIKESKKK